MKPQNTGFARIKKATRFSWLGLKAAYIHEAAFRQELAMAIVLIPIALISPITAVEKALLISSMLLVFIVELINSAIEAAIDRFGGEIHELSGRAKDIGSAAVFIALILMASNWLLILGDDILRFVLKSFA